LDAFVLLTDGRGLIVSQTPETVLQTKVHGNWWRWLFDPHALKLGESFRLLVVGLGDPGLFIFPQIFDVTWAG
jgi:hypothetical protein